MQLVGWIGKQDNDSESKANISNINVAKTATDRQKEGAMIINMAFANAEEAIAA